MKIRIKFRKQGIMKFIGHLDIMRYFQKAMRRAEIDICYSEGFSPHMIMSFAAPLGVGITSEGEYFDIEVLSTQDSKTALKKLNDAMFLLYVNFLRIPINLLIKDSKTLWGNIVRKFFFYIWCYTIHPMKFLRLN